MITQPIKKLLFNGSPVKTFYITRLQQSQIREKVYLNVAGRSLDITRNNSMICLDPFCMAAWLPANEISNLDAASGIIEFKTNDILSASINVSLIEKIDMVKGSLFLFRIQSVRNHQLNALKREMLFRYFLRSKKNTYNSRRVVSALYSYPRSIIIVSYVDDEYCNVFPMDIHGYIEEEGIYLLGLRTTNITLDKILNAGKVVVCDTDTVDINSVYALGKHSSTAPTPVDQLPFDTIKSEVFGFPVPACSGGYKEIEVFEHKKMGYHMLMIGRVINNKTLKPNPESLYHVGFLQFQNSNYTSIEGLF
jgi:flavin reductase (DIM6/NTAB) family NADH-FMN oxidoreductase RutF